MHDYDIHEVFYMSFEIHGDKLHKAMHSCIHVHNVLMLNCDIHGLLAMGQK